MTTTDAWLSNESVAGWYAVLAFRRGPAIGRIHRQGTRFWIAECGTCSQPVGDGRTRPEAADVLRVHARVHRGRA